MRRRDDHKALNHVLVHVCNSPCNFASPAGRTVSQAKAGIPGMISSPNLAEAEGAATKDDYAYMAGDMTLHTSLDNVQALVSLLINPA